MKKKHYITPELVAVDFRAERGYASSDITGDPLPGMLQLLFDQSNPGETETFELRSGWGEEEENNTFWN